MRDLKTFFLPWFSIAGLIALWQVYIWIFKPSGFFLPSPIAVSLKMWQMRWKIFEYLKYTLAEALGGFAIGNIIGILLAILFCHLKILEKMFLKLLIAIQTTPVVIYIPFLIIIFNYGLFPNTVAAILGAVFPCAVSMTAGLKLINVEGANRLQYTLCFGATKWQILWKLRFPNSLPSLFTTLKLTAVFCFIGAITGELLGGGKGMGYLIMILMSQQDRAGLLAIAIVLAVVSVLVYAVIVSVEKKVISWAQEK